MLRGVAPAKKPPTGVPWRLASRYRDLAHSARRAAAFHHECARVSDRRQRPPALGQPVQPGRQRRLARRNHRRGHTLAARRRRQPGARRQRGGRQGQAKIPREDLLGLGVRGVGRLLHAILVAQCARADGGAFQDHDEGRGVPDFVRLRAVLRRGPGTGGVGPDLPQRAVPQTLSRDPEQPGSVAVRAAARHRALQCGQKPGCASGRDVSRVSRHQARQSAQPARLHHPARIHQAHQVHLATVFLPAGPVLRSALPPPLPCRLR